MDIVAHRIRTRPEQIGNTMLNLVYLEHRFINQPTIWFEADVSMTKDGKPIIYHPGTINPDPTTMIWPEIEYSLFNIMTAEKLLNHMCSIPRFHCFLDIKQDSKELIAKLVEMIIGRNIQDRVYITAFEKRIKFLGLESGARLLEHAQKLDPRIKINIILAWPGNILKIVDGYKPDAISIGWLEEPPDIRWASKKVFNLATCICDLKPQIREAKKRGIKILAGVANDIQSFSYFADLGCSAVSTDNPGLIANCLEREGWHDKR